MMFNFFSRGIPVEARGKLEELGPRGISVLAFTPGNGWLIVTRDGVRFGRNVPPECFGRLSALQDAGDNVLTVAFAPQGGWVIVTDRNLAMRGIPDECARKLREYFNAGRAISCVAFPPAGGNSWVILAGSHLFARNIDDQCYQYLCNCLPSTRPAKRVAFNRGGGWAVLAEEYHWVHRVASTCERSMNLLHDGSMIVDHAVFSPAGGWCVASNTPIRRRRRDTIRLIEQTVVQDGGRWHSIWDRMEKYKVPGVGVAVVVENQLAWACSYGLLEAGTDQYVHTDSAFQAASISKPVSAVGFLRQVQDRRIRLDENVNPYLSWNLPLCPSADPSWKKLVTLRKLLMHRGGISGRGVPDAGGMCNNFGGFSGYPDVDGVAVPSLRQILDGAAPANTSAVQLTYKPAEDASYYSGPGYLILMHLLERLTGLSFNTWMIRNVLAAAGMRDSTFRLTLPARLTRGAAGHDASGAVIPGKRNRYPESAAAGLYTTPSDLCRFIILLNQRGTIDGTSVLEQNLVDTMVLRGTGILIQDAGTPSFHYWHNGVNVGFRCLLKGYPRRRSGVVVMTNGDAGDTLHNELVSAIVRTYRW